MPWFKIVLYTARAKLDLSFVLARQRFLATRRCVLMRRERTHYDRSNLREKVYLFPLSSYTCILKRTQVHNGRLKLKNPSG